MVAPLLFLALFAAPSHAQSFSALGLPRSVSKPLLQGLLQRFVDQEYKKAFKHLGDERDFDHGHLLFAKGSDKPVAILYHTQELASYEPPGSSFAFLDPAARNWLQWVDDGRVANASSFLRKGFPRGPAWDLFVSEDLPVLKAHHTIIDKMLDPLSIGADTTRSDQWVFTRSACGAGGPAADDNGIQVRVPGEGRVCLSLTRS